MSNELQRLTEVAPDVWVADGPTVSFYSFPYPTRMAVVRLPDGLWVWSPIGLDDQLCDEVQSLGEVRWLTEPNKLHHLFLQPWLDTFANARAYAPPGLAAKLPELAFDAELGDEPPAEWATWIDQVIVHGSAAMEEVLFFHRPSATCFVGDLIQRHDPAAFTSWRRWLMNADGLAGEHGSTPREWRATFFDRGPGRAALEKALAWEPENLIIAHGQCAQGDGATVLADGLDWLTKPWPA